MAKIVGRRARRVGIGLIGILALACGTDEGIGHVAPGSGGQNDDAGTGGEAGQGGQAGTAGAAGTGTNPSLQPPPVSDGSVPPGCSAPLDRTTALSFYDAARCLFEGPRAVQKQLTATLDRERIAVVRGRVIDNAGQPLTGVRVSVLHQEQLGFTETRKGGYYDLAVNGGGELTMRFELAGHITAQRRRATAWRRYTTFPDVALLPPATAASPVTFATLSKPTLVRGPTLRDASGERDQRVLFGPGTHAVAKLADGSERELPTASVVITEMTVGERGVQAMPGDLPPTSGYTYAVELDVAEAQGLGAERVEFDPPLVSYVHNFLGFPAGIAVPLGYYDRERDRWEASDSGLVIAIVGEDGGHARVDATGDGQAESAEELLALGITDDELVALAESYDAPASLWRVRLPHFSTWDCNWPFGPPDDADFPDADGEGLGGPDDCRRSVFGSIIGCEDQTLGERFPVSGTPFLLAYQSERAPGRADRNGVRIQLSGATVPASLKRIELELDVLGNRTTKTFDPLPGQSFDWTWDGRDAYGRLVQGRQPVEARIGYVYDGSYERGERFGQPATGSVIQGSRTREEVVLWSTWSGKVGGFDQAPAGIGGLSLDVHHVFDPEGGALYLGDGTQRTAEHLGDRITRVAGSEASGFDGDGGPATQARLKQPHGIAIAPDGTVYLADENNNRIRRIAPNGTIDTYAGNGDVGSAGDGGPALMASIEQPLGIELALDGSLYVAERGSHRVRVIGKDGVIRTAAGGGTPADGVGDGGPAVEAELVEPHDLALGQDGSLYIADNEGNRIRRVAPDGTIETVAGTGPATSTGDGGPAVECTLNSPLGIAIAPDGSLIVAEFDGNRLRRITPTGGVETVAGTGESGFSGDGGAATLAQLYHPHAVDVAPDGTIFFSDEGNRRVRRVTPDGKITTIAGNGNSPSSEDTGAPLGTGLTQPRVLARHRDGSLWLGDYSDSIVEKIEPALPGFNAGEHLIASASGTEVYHFDPDGRHLETIDALVGVTAYSFEYDDAGRLSAVVDRSGQRTALARDAGAITITAPDGAKTRLELGGNGYVQSVADALEQHFGLTFGDTGLLTELSLPATPPDVHRFAYDAQGRLISDTSPSGLVQTLERTATASGFEVALRSNGSRVERHGVELGTSLGSTRRRLTHADGTQTSAELAPGTATFTMPTGTASVRNAVDPRFGVQAEYPAEISEDFGPFRRVTSTLRTIELRDPTDPLSLAKWTETRTVDTRQQTQVFDAATRTVTNTSALGKVSKVTLDERGRVASAEVANLAKISFSRDDRGRVTRILNGTRATSLEYGSGGGLSAIVDALGNRHGFERDALGRTTSQALPGGAAVTLGYTPLSGLSAVTPPGRERHEFSWAPGNLLASYTPPALAGTRAPITFGRDAFEALTSISYPGGASVGLAYAPETGKLTTVSLAEGTARFAYDATQGLLRQAATDEVTLDYSYDGSFLAGERYTGAIDGHVFWQRDAAYRVSSVDVSGGQASRYVYDDDDLVTSAGDETLSRATASGLVLGAALGTTNERFEYDEYGALATQTVTQGGSTLYARSDTRDALGRVSSRTETVQGQTSTLSYVYDARGRLTEVTRGGSLVERYAYDANDNRSSAERSGVTTPASYDAQDRLIQSGDASYTFDAAGNLASVTRAGTTRSFHYDAAGVLRSATLGDGKKIAYVIDARGRRVAKKVNGTLALGFLYRNNLKPVAEIAANGSSVSATFVYGVRSNVPDYMVKGNVTYRIISDALGSVRLVVDAATGAVAQRLDYDAFGRVIADTSPGFQPFGFAGGLYDPDTGLVRFGVRDYDAETGRFTGRDPKLFDGQQANLYAYVGNDPVNLGDPHGSIPAAIAAGAAWGFGLDVALQVAQNGGNWGCVDWGSAATAGVIGGLGGVLGILGKGKAGWEFSHAIPKRFIGRFGLPPSIINSTANGTHVPWWFHAATDPYRFRFVPAALKGTIPQLPAGLAQAARIPPWVISGVVGAAATGNDSASSDDSDDDD